MFTHHGKKRTLQHNLQIASILSFVAGIVNVAGFLAVKRLTTNVTGHFAFFVDALFKLHFSESLVYFLYILFFFLGSFFSGFLVEFISRRNDSFSYAVPATAEIILLTFIGMSGENLIMNHPNYIAYILLFAMGLQNSLVTKISNAAVRTTHLTGLFTDLGIELSQLFFYKEANERIKLFASIKLRFTIIGFFFTGAITGGVFYLAIGLQVLLIGVAALLVGLVYDGIKIKLLKLARKLRV